MSWIDWIQSYSSEGVAPPTLLPPLILSIRNIL